MSSIKTIWLLLIALLAVGRPLLGQEARGTILGRVVDPTDAVIVDAKVEAINTDTGVHATSLTNETGDYILPFLIPGPYTLTVSNKGFRNYTRTGITVRQSERVTLDVTLQLG